MEDEEQHGVSRDSALGNLDLSDPRAAYRFDAMKQLIEQVAKDHPQAQVFLAAANLRHATETAIASQQSSSNGFRGQSDPLIMMKHPEDLPDYWWHFAKHMNTAPRTQLALPTSQGIAAASPNAADVQ